MSTIIICPTCNGRGQVVASVESTRFSGGISYACCPRCHGHGRVPPRSEELADRVDGRLWNHLSTLAMRATVYCPDDLAQAIKDTVGRVSTSAKGTDGGSE